MQKTTKEEVTDKEDIKLLENLLELERKMDNLIYEKRLEMQEWLSLSSKFRYKIQVTVSAYFVIPPSYTLVADNLTLPASKQSISNISNLPNLEVKIEGKIVGIIPIANNYSFNETNPLVDQPDLSKSQKLFSNFLKSIVFEFDPTIYGSDMKCIEWTRNSKTVETDVFLAKRPVLNKNKICATIVLNLDHNPARFELSNKLSTLLGIRSNTKAQIIGMMWRYITQNNLLDTFKPELVHCNDILKEIFKVDEFLISSLPTLLLPHLLPPQPHTFIFDIENPLFKGPLSSGYYCSSVRVFEIFFELTDSLNRESSHSFVVEYDNKTFSMDSNDLKALEVKTKQINENIVNIKSKIKDYKRYVDNPYAFITQWLNNQCKEASSQNASGDQKHSYHEDEKSYEYFCKPWIPEYIHRYLFTQIESKSDELKRALT